MIAHLWRGVLWEGFMKMGCGVWTIMKNRIILCQTHICVKWASDWRAWWDQALAENIKYKPGAEILGECWESRCNTENHKLSGEAPGMNTTEKAAHRGGHGTPRLVERSGLDIAPKLLAVNSHPKPHQDRKQDRRQLTQNGGRLPPRIGGIPLLCPEKLLRPGLLAVDPNKQGARWEHCKPSLPSPHGYFRVNRGVGKE